MRWDCLRSITEEVVCICQIHRCTLLAGTNNTYICNTTSIVCKKRVGREKAAVSTALAVCNQLTGCSPFIMENRWRTLTTATTLSSQWTDAASRAGKLDQQVNGVHAKRR